MIALNVTLLIAIHLVAGATATPAAADWWQPTPGLSWQWQLDGPFIRADQPIDVYDLDGELTDRDLVQSLRADGLRVICYVNVGSLESWRADAGAFPESVIGNVYPGWEDERFLDIRRLDVIAPILEARFDQCAAKGFDAIEPDNMDAWDADTGFDLDRDDALRYAAWLADGAHARGLAIAQKNAPGLTPELADTFDFAITESCAEDDWCDAMRPYIDGGKAVLAAEYTDVTSPAGFRAMCADQGLTGLSLIHKHRDLDAWLDTCRQ